MEHLKNMAIIGVGNCGGQVANLAEQKYDSIFDCIYINTSSDDLAMIKTQNSDLVYKIGGENDVEGSGKNRKKMKEYLRASFKEVLGDTRFRECIKCMKYVFIVGSTAGGTGSGSMLIITAMMRANYPAIHFIPVAVLPSDEASLGELGNTKEFLRDLYDVLGPSTSYMMYDNSQVDRNGISTVEVKKRVNENIVEDLRVLSCVDNYPTPYDSIDPADMEVIITTPGRILVARINKHLTEKAMEDNNIDDMLIKAIKHSCHAETDRNKRVVRWGIITYFTEPVMKLFTSQLDGLAAFLGTPVERFDHNAVNDKSDDLNFIYLIASGLPPINDRASDINSRIEALIQALPSDEDRYIFSGEDVSYDAIEKRKAAVRQAKIDDQNIPSPDEVFAMFDK